MSAVTGISGIQLSAASAAYAPTNSADVSAIASAYQVVSATATQLNAGTAYVTSINETPISAARAGNAANASLANSAWYDGTGRLISALPDEATVSSIASAYAESAVSSKLDESATADFYSTSNPSGFITGVDLSNYATTAYVDSSVSSFVDSAYVESQVSGKEDKLTFGYDDSAISSINGSALAGGGAQVVTAVGTETAITPDGAGDVVTSINGNYISALSADSAFQATYDDLGRRLTGLPDDLTVSAIASAYAASSQVVTSLQYATSESATVASTVTADTAVGYGARDISADYYDYGYGPWTDYDSSRPLVQVRLTAVGNMANYSSNPYYLYVVPYGATNNGNVSNTGDLTGALAYGEFSGGMNDLIVAEGTGSAYSQDPTYVVVNFDVTHVPFVGSEPAFWGTVEEHYAVVDIDEGTKPVFCVAGGYYGSDLFEVRGNTTAELDFGSSVTVRAVSGINELEIAGAGGIDSATVSAIASSYAEDVSAAASGAVSAVSSNSANWMKLSSCFSGLDGIVTAVGSSTMFTASASSFMGVGSAIKSTTGSSGGSFPYVDYAMGLSGDYYHSVKLSAHEAQTYIKYMDVGGSISTNYLGPTAYITGVSGDISAYSTYGAFTLDYTANSIEPLAFQSDLPSYSYDSNNAISAINGSALAGGGAGGDYVEKSATEVTIGSSNTASSTSFAQGIGNSAAYRSFAQGTGNTASYRSFALGAENSAAYDSFAQGLMNTAASTDFAQGNHNFASSRSFAQGDYNSASILSFAQGRNVSAWSVAAVFGQYNLHGDGDTSTGDSAAFAIGNGTASDARHDLMLVTKDGEITMYSSTADTTGTGIMSSIRALSANAGGIDSATCSAIASSYAESAVSSKADSSALSSYALSADVSGTVDLVSTQSANWGGSALALSAGPGVKLEKVGDTLVASTDETLLWSGSCLTQGGAAATLSEAASNFEKIEIHAIPNPSTTYVNPQIFTYPGSNTAGAYLCPFMTTGLKGKFSCGLWTITNGTSFNLIAAGQTDSYPSQNWDNSYGGVVKVVGINRTAEA